MTRIVCISDTHMMHERIEVPDGDVLIHAGDFLNAGTQEELIRFLEWLRTQPHELKIVVAGNHDIAVQQMEFDAAWGFFEEAGAVYLEDTHHIQGGLKFYGVPWTPDFFPDRWAFNNSQSGRTAGEIWSAVPDDTNVLISHGPPLGWGDRVGGDHLGSPTLARHLTRVKPSLFICGHIHGGYGYEMVGGYWGPTHCANASICTEAYEPANAPIVVEL